VAESAFGRLPNRSELSLHAEAALRALDDAGLAFSDVDGLLAVSGGMYRMPTVLVGEYLGLNPQFTDSTSVGGASFDVMVRHAQAAIEQGLCDVALITYGSNQLSARGRTIGTRSDPLSNLAAQYEDPYGLNIVSAYAMAAQRHMFEYGTTSEQLAEIAVATRLHAGMNPNAMYRDPITIANVLESRMIATPLHLLDCSVVSDGGGAVVLTTAERAADLPKTAVQILGAAEGFSHHHVMQMSSVTDTGAQASGRRCFEQAGLKPADVDVLEVYDSFTITVLLTLEDLGFCKKGEGGSFVADGRLRPGGSLPINTDGGGLSSCHPGMRGIFLVIEAVRQLRGECGGRQVPDCEVAMVHGTGGWLSAQGTLLLAAGGSF
jgi:acetyl-CoA acetyltransferase